MNSKTRIIQTAFAVLLMLAAVVVFFWEHVSVFLFPRTSYERPDEVAQVIASPSVQPETTPSPTAAASQAPQSTPEATPEPTPTPVPVMGEKWDELYAVNDDIQGWIKIDETEIDYPVVMAKPEDDALAEDGFYYLHNNFDRKRDSQGAVFLYPGSDILSSRNLSIYGHNQRNLRMFGTLKYYNYLWSSRALEQYQKSPLVQFDTIYGDGTYKMFAFLLVDEEESGFFNFMYNDFQSEDVFLSYVDHLRMHSLINTSVDVQEGDELITIITCTSESLIKQGKFIIVARKVRPGESLEVDVESASYNPDALVPAVVQRAWSQKVPLPAE
ncbi:MAG: class B sortase [Christensenellales bacterium]|jgi:SrtB family sortase